MTESNTPAQWRLWTLPALMLIALALRVGFINRPFWPDESFSSTLSTQRMPKLLEFCRADVHPPTYYIILKYWNMLGCHLTGVNEREEAWTALRFEVFQLSTTGFFTYVNESGVEKKTPGIFPDFWDSWRLAPLPYLRVPSILIGVLGVALTWFLAARLYPAHPSIWILAATVTALSPFRVTWDTVIRNYTWVSAFVILATIFALSGAARRCWRWWGPALTIAIATALLFHYAALIILPFLCLVMWRDEKWSFRGLTGPLFLVVGFMIAAAVWGDAFLQQRETLVPMESFEWSKLAMRLLSQMNTVTHDYWQFVFSYGVAGILNPHDSVLYYPAFIFYAGGVGAALYGLYKSSTHADWTVTILTFGPPLTILAANAMRPGSAPLMPRHFYPFTPFFYVFLAMGWRRLGLALWGIWQERHGRAPAE